MLELQQRAFILKLGVVMKKTIVTSHSYHFKKMTTELTVMHLHHCVKIAYRPPAGRDGPPPPPPSRTQAAVWGMSGSSSGMGGGEGP